MKALIAAAALALIAAPAAAQEAATDITFTFTVGQPTGQIMVALYDSAAAYGGSGAPVRVARVEVSGAIVQAAFEGLPAGDYAMKAFHDVDGDGQMATNPFGMPTEPYAFSNNAVGNMGPAGWDRAHFSATGAVIQTIDLAR
jgi:uncharacterized protein (DUF2141 family)